MKESDWKVFKDIKEKTFEKYCTLTLEELQEVILIKKSMIIIGQKHG